MNLCQANLFYWKETCRKKLLESKDLNIRHQLVGLKSKLTLPKKQYQRLDKAVRSSKDDKNLSESLRKKKLML